jgi:hypothetical protein
MTSETLSDLQVSLKDALDLAIAAGAPLPLLEKIAAASALVLALVELPRHTLIGDVITRAHWALNAWEDWQKQRPGKVAA